MTAGTFADIVFILTDDQDRVLGPAGYDPLGSLAAMPQLRRGLLEQGALVENFYVNTPICCPSRTEFFSGRYFHNVGPPTVTKGQLCMHADTSVVSNNNTGLFGLLARAGYNVGAFGKVTNDQQSMLKALAASGSAAYIDSPIEYNDYDGLGYYRHFPNGSSFVETLSTATPEFGTTYQTTQIGNRTLRWLDEAADGARPFFAYVGPHAPHYPAEPAPWHRHAFDSISAPRTPNYNVSSPDKAQHVAQNAPLSARAKCWEDQHFRDRWASLLAVDDLVRAILAKLGAAQLLERTFVLYSSDHGYKQGQWRIGTSKQHPYETDVRIPFLIRGPGVAAGTNLSSALGGSVDVLPTLLELAAGPAYVAAVAPDGRSLAGLLVPSLRPVLPPPPPPRGAYLNEYLSVGTYYNDHSTCWEDGTSTTDRCGGPMPRGPEGSDPKADCVESTEVGEGNCFFVDSTHSNSWRQLRLLNGTHDLNYVEYDPAWQFKTTGPTGAGLQHYELYDIRADPYQLENIYPAASNGTRAELHAMLARYWKCRAASCP